MKIGLLLWHSIQNPKKAQIIWSSERPPVCWYPRTIPLFLSVIRQDIEVSCWNWIGMMNGCFLAWIVIKSWVFCQAKWGLWFKWQMVFIFFFVDEGFDYTYSFCCRCTVLEMQEHCSLIKHWILTDVFVSLMVLFLSNETSKTGDCGHKLINVMGCGETNIVKETSDLVFEKAWWVASECQEYFCVK